MESGTHIFDPAYVDVWAVALNFLFILLELGSANCGLQPNLGHHLFICKACELEWFLHFLNS